MQRVDVGKKSIAAVVGSVLVGVLAFFVNAVGAVSVIQSFGFVPKVDFSDVVIFEVDIKWPFSEVPDFPVDMNKSWGRFEMHYSGDNLPREGVPMSVSAWRPRSNEFKVFGIPNSEYFRGGSSDEYQTPQSGIGLVGWELDVPLEYLEEIWVCRNQELLAVGPWSLFQSDFSRVVVLPPGPEQEALGKKIEVVLDVREEDVVLDIAHILLEMSKDEAKEYLDNHKGGEVEILGTIIKVDELMNPFKIRMFMGELRVVKASFGTKPLDCRQSSVFEQLDDFRS